MNWSRFLLVESGDDALPVTKLTPVAIDKGFQLNPSPDPRKTEIDKRLRNGAFLVECDWKKQSALLKSQKLVDRPIKVLTQP